MNKTLPTRQRLHAEFAAALERAFPELKDIYIIMLTAKGQAADRARGEEVKANEYITKPFNPDEILQKASDILGVQI